MHQEVKFSAVHTCTLLILVLKSCHKSGLSLCPGEPLATKLSSKESPTKKPVHNGDGK